MTKFFVGLYNYFERHKVLFYLSLSVCILFMALFAAQVRFEENVTSFFPDTKDSQNAINVFENLKIKDKIMIMLSGKDGVADADSLIEAAETIKQDLQQQAEGTLIKEIFSKADENLINSVGDFVYDNLPLFLSDEDYQRLDTLLTAGNIAALMQKNYSNLISPAGFALKNYIMRDPLGLGSQVEIQNAVEERMAGKRRRGGSTISQQTAKNVFLWPTSSWVRKGLEAYFTALIELCWSKQRIMEVYLNSIEMGDGIYGAEAVAQQHFGRPAEKLTRANCALIAATLPNPLKYSSKNPSRYMLKRQTAIMRQMKHIDLFK